jgi:Putative archaeal flagellar protein F
MFIMLPMAPSVSGAYAVIGFVVVVGIGSIYVAFSNAGEELSDALADQGADFSEQAQTEINITSTTYDGSVLVVNVTNEGDPQLSINRTDVLVNGQYISADSLSYSVDGRADTTVWNQEETLQFRINFDSPSRVMVVTDHGVAAATDINPFRIASIVGYTDNDATRSIDDGQSATQYSTTGQAIGPVVLNFFSENETELPSVNTGGDVVIATASGSQSTLATDARASNSRLAAGRWQGSSASVFFVDSSTQNIVRVDSDGSTATVDSVEAQGVSGIGDFDGDDADELIYGGNGPVDGNSDSVNYIDDDGTALGTGQGYGVSAGIGLGEPGDFDGDGTVRIPIIDGSNDIILVDSTGSTTRLTNSGPAAKSPMATRDIDDDSEQEIIFVNTNGNINYLDEVLTQNNIETLTDGQGGTVAADVDAGVG